MCTLSQTTKFLQRLCEAVLFKIDPFSKPRKIYFRNGSIPFDGIPFNIVGVKVFDCKHGPDRKEASKSKLAKAKQTVTILETGGQQMVGAGNLICLLVTGAQK